MAHIFKHPTTKTKGIVVFTHKEMRWFFFNKKKLIKSLAKKFSFKKSFEITKTLISTNKLVDPFKKIQCQYFIGVHYGSNPTNDIYFKNCDFIMTPNKINITIDDHIIRIPLISRNFVPSLFTNRHQKKYWDILCMSRCQKFKNLDLLLKSVRKIYDLNYDYKILIFTQKNKDKDSKGFYTSLMDDYYELFSNKERNNFSIIQLSSEVALLGLSSELMVHLYNSAKIFTLFSQTEGGSKVISEALMCGLPVVVKNDLVGGGRDFLTKENSMFFSSYDTAHEVLIEAVDNYENFKVEPEQSRTLLGETESLEKLKGYFEILFDKHSQKFDGNLINTDRLNFRLPAHLNVDIEWAKDRFNTADILSMEQLTTFMDHLKFEIFKNS